MKVTRMSREAIQNAANEFSACGCLNARRHGEELALCGTSVPLRALRTIAVAVAVAFTMPVLTDEAAAFEGTLIIIRGGSGGDASAASPAKTEELVPLAMQSGDTWQNVALGGGGAVSGVVADPTTPGRIYMYTDVGGAYRKDPGGNVWIPITDKIPGDDSGAYYGVDSLAVDPGNADTVYILTARFTYHTPRIYKTTNAAAAMPDWTQKGLPVGAKEGVGSGRGERLQVDPYNSNVLYFATRNVGFWKSTNGGSSWSRITAVPVGGANYAGESFVALDPGGGTSTVGGITVGKYIYVGVTSDGAGNGGIWKSSDGGRSWIQMDSTLAAPRQGRVASDGTFYFSASTAVGRVSRAGTTITYITPAGSSRPYCAIAVDPTDPNIVVVSERLAKPYTTTWRTADALSATPTWTVASTSKITENPVRDTSQWFARIDALAIDPTDHSVWMAEWLGVLHNPDLSNPTSPWEFVYEGHEETVPHTLIGMPGGTTGGAELLSGL
jgi:hypothetical protein